MTETDFERLEKIFKEIGIKYKLETYKEQQAGPFVDKKFHWNQEIKFEDKFEGDRLISNTYYTLHFMNDKFIDQKMCHGGSR
jgi:hypothetical protein